MWWEFSRGSKLFALLPVLFLLLFALNTSNETISQNFSDFIEVDEFLDLTNQTQDNQTAEEFIPIDEFLNLTETPMQNETAGGLPEPEEQLNLTNETQQNETVELPPEPPPEENQTGFMDIDEFINETGTEENETQEGFMGVEEYLNLTNQTEHHKANESFENESLAPPNFTLVNDSISKQNATNVANFPDRIPFTLIDANGLSVDASVSFTKNGKEVTPVSGGAPPPRAAASEAAITKFGIAPGKYDMRIILPKPAQPADAVHLSTSPIPSMMMGGDSGAAATSSKEAALPVPVSEVLFRDVEITPDTNFTLKLEGLPASATPFGKNTKQAYAIDPTSFTFSEGELTVTARGAELYKCANWTYDEQKCNGKWIKIMDITPGENYTVIIDAADPAYAEYNSTLGAPRCANYTSPCIANSSLLRSRDSLATAEPNQPNTVDGCTDGGSGTYMSDESVENITIESLTAPIDVFNEGDTVRVNATVYCWNTGANDNLNLVYANDASNPSWTVKNYSSTCIAGGFVDVSGTFVLDNTPGEHVVRLIIQYNGNVADTCGTGAYDDNDDLVFQVNGTPPSVNLVSPAEGATVYEGIEQFTFNVTDASSCTLYIDGVQDQPTTISAAADTNYVFNASLLSGAHTWQVRCGAISSEVRNVTQSPKNIVFEDTFTSSGGFSPDATNSAPWQRGNATQVLGCHLDSSCWGTGLSANYNAAGPYDDFLTKSVSMNLSDYANVSFAFYHYRYFENAATLYDAGVVDINNGTGWVRLTPEGGYSGTVDNGFSNPLGGQQAYGYHGTGWELEEFNLSSYSGQGNVTLRFYFAVDSSVNDRGWFVDDVKVFGDPQVDYGIISVWDTSDTQTVIPGQNNTFYANYSYFNGTPIPGPSGTCNITTNATFQMSYNSALGTYEFNQSFPSATSGNFTVTCQLNSSFIPDSKTGDYVITGVSHTNLTCWEYQDPVAPAYLGGYNQMFLFCNYSYLNDTPVNSDGICTWQDETFIDYYFFGQETFNQMDVSFFGERQILYSFDGVWAELNASKGQGKVACYNETQGSMVVHMCLDYLNTSQDVNNNLNNSNESANCFPVGTMTCGQFSWLAGVPKGTFSWVSMDLNMTDFYNTWNAIGSPYLVDMQFTYECPNCTYSLYTTPYNVSDYGTDLVALYRFDEFADNGTANTSVDAAGNLNLTKFGSVGISPGQVNNSLNFSSAIGYIYAPDATGFDVLSQVTAEAYIKLEYDSPKERAILSKWAYSPVSECGSAMDQSCLDQRSTRMYLDKEGHLNVQFSHNGKNSGTVTLRDPAKFPVGEWVHAGFVFNGTHIRLYRNSVIVAETEDFSGYKIHDGTAPWIVGADDAGNHDFAEGLLIDELRVIKRGLEDWEFVSHADADLWLIKSQSIPETYHTFISEELSGNKRNFTRPSNDYGENLVKLSVLGQALNMSFNSTTGLYSGHRAIPYGFHPGTYTINYSCSKTAAEPQSVLSDWQVYSSAPNCSIDGYLSSIPLGSYQYVNWSLNSNTPPLVAYYNVTHSDGHVYSYYNTQLTNGSTYVNHAPGIAEITCYVENENSSYSSTKEFNITGPTDCFYASGEGATYVLASDLNNTKEDSACITVDADNVTIDCAGHSIFGNGTGSGILVHGHNETTLKNCNITSYGYGIQWLSSNHGELRNNTLSNNTNGIFIDPSYNNTIIQNQAFNNSANGLYLYDSHNNTLMNNSAYNNSQDGFLLWASTYNNLTNNTAYENGRWGFTIYLDSDHNTLLNNSAYNNSQDGFVLWDGSYNTLSENKAFNNTRHGIIAYLNSSNNNFTENQAYENSQTGIVLYDHSDYNRLYNNTVYLNSNTGFTLFNSSNNSLADNIAYQNWIGHYLQLSPENLLQGEVARFNYNNGFYLYDSNSSTFDSCYAYNNSANGFLIEDYSANNLITGSHAFNNSGNGFVFRDSSRYNNLTGSYAYDNVWWGVRIFNSATGIYLMHNELSNNSRDGLRMESGSNNITLINNTIFNNSWNGANITDCNYTSFSSGNNVSNNTVFGIYFNNSHNLTIAGSHINGNGNDGISGSNSDYANISSNIAIENSGDEIFLIYSTSSYIGYNTLGESINPYLVTDDPTNHTLYGQVGGPASDSIDTPYNHHGTVIGNNGSNTYAGVRCDGCTNMSIRENRFSHVVFGVGSSNMTDCNITYNNITNGSSSGLYLIVNIVGNRFIENNLSNFTYHGAYLSGVSQNVFLNNTAHNNAINGFLLERSSSNNLLENNTAYGNPNSGFHLENCSYNNLTGNIAHTSTNDGFRVSAPSQFNILLGNTAYLNSQNGFYIDGAANNSLENNSAYLNADGFFLNGASFNNFTNNNASSQLYGFYISSSNNNTIFGGEVYNNSAVGIYIYMDENTTLSNCTVYENGEGIYLWNSSGAYLQNNRVYDNSIGFRARNTGAAPFTYNMANTLFLPASGTLENYTNLSVYDSIEAATAYTVNWTSNSSALPITSISFAQKFVNISTVAGTPAIEEITWHWMDSELPGYDEDYFELWKYNSSGWAMLNNTPDTASNWIKQYNMDPASEYGILQNNQPPIVENVTLNSTYGTNYTNENLTVYYDSYDPGGRPVKNITNWYLGGASLEALNMPFEGGSNSTFTRDYSGYGNNGTVSGAVWNSSAGHDGFGAYGFNGTHSINCGNSSSLNITGAFTIEAWLKPSSSVSEGIIIAKPHSSFSAPYVTYGLGYSTSNNYDIALSNGSTQVNCPTPSNTVNTTKYQHVVATWDGSTAKIYIDGEANSTCTFSPFSLNSVSQPLYLGYYPFGSGNYNYEGIMDDVRVYSRALSPEQVREHYLNGVDTFVSQETQAGETWKACITPNNGLMDGQQNCSNNLTVRSTNCPVISSPGTYIQIADYFGAPNNASPRAGTVCVKIASSDVVFDCNSYNITNNGTAGTTRAIILNGSLTNVTVRNCPGLSGYSYGLETFQSNESVFRNLTAFNNSLYGIYVAASHNNSIHDSIFYNNSIAGGLSTSGTRNLYQNNSFSNNPNYGFYLQSSSDYNNFTNNTFNNNSLYGLHLFLAHNNSISGSIAAENGVYGIYLDQSTRNNLTNNTAHGNSGNGFVLSSSDGNRLLNNTAYGNVDSGTASGFFAQNSEYNVFTGNSAHNNSQHGFSFSSSNHTNLHNNSAYNNSFDGIQLFSNCTNNNLTENILFGNLQNGIWLDVRSSFNLLENNTAYDNALSGIHLTDLSNNNTLTNNTAYDNSNGFALTIGFNLALPVSNNTLQGNRAYNNTNGYLLEHNASLNFLENNLAYENDDGFSLSSAYNNTFISIHSYNNTYSGVSISGGDGNSFTNITAENNTDDGFYALDSSNITIDPSKLKNNGANGINLNNCEDILLENVTVNDNKGHGLHMVNLERTRILTSEFCNNHQYGIRLHHTIDTNISNSLICNNTEYGLRSDDSNNTLSFSNEITNNTITGVYLDSNSNSNSFNDTFICFNGFDISNDSAFSTGSLDVCDSYTNWSENGHEGCTFRCTDIWHYFYGNVSGNLMLAPTQSDTFYSWLWNGQSGSIYVARSGAGIQWDSLIALGRNTTQQNSTNDFTELDQVLGISAEPDNINYTFSYDGSNPNFTANVTIFEHPVPYVPLANTNLFDPTYQFGVVWDSSEGGPEFNTSLNQDVVFGTGIENSGAYQYEIRVPETLATYKGGNLVEFWVELD